MTTSLGETNDRGNPETGISSWARGRDATDRDMRGRVEPYSQNYLLQMHGISICRRDILPM